MFGFRISRRAMVSAKRIESTAEIYPKHDTTSKKVPWEAEKLPGTMDCLLARNLKDFRIRKHC